STTAAAAQTGSLRSASMTGGVAARTTRSTFRAGSGGNGDSWAAVGAVAATQSSVARIGRLDRSIGSVVVSVARGAPGLGAAPGDEVAVGRRRSAARKPYQTRRPVAWLW